MTSAAEPPNTLAIVAIRAGLHGVAGTVTPAGATGVPVVGTELAAGALAGAPGVAVAGCAGGAIATPLTVSQSAAILSAASLSTRSLPSPQVTRSATSPFDTRRSSPAPPSTVSTPRLPKISSLPLPPVSLSLPGPPESRDGTLVWLMSVSLRSPPSRMILVTLGAEHVTLEAPAAVQPEPGCMAAPW